MPAARFEAGREGEAGDGEANHLALTATEAANGITHEKDMVEVVSAQGGAAKGLAGTVLALDGDTVERVFAEVRSFRAIRVRALSPFV
jgi:hypothetical protein